MCCEVDFVICMLWLELLDLIVRWFGYFEMGIYVLCCYLVECGELVVGSVFDGYDLVMY